MEKKIKSVTLYDIIFPIGGIGFLLASLTGRMRSVGLIAIVAINYFWDLVILFGALFFAKRKDLLFKRRLYIYALLAMAFGLIADFIAFISSQIIGFYLGNIQMFKGNMVIFASAGLVNALLLFGFHYPLSRAVFKLNHRQGIIVGILMAILTNLFLGGLVGLIFPRR